MTPLKLFYSPGACSFAAHAILHDLGLPFTAERVTIAKGEHLAPTYLAINPRGRIPTLLVGNTPITELSGILTWLGQQSDSLFPPPGTIEAARCSEWLAWLTSSVHISFALIWRGERFLDDARLYPLLRARGFALLSEQFSEIESRLKGPYALGERYSVVDPNLIVFYRWGLRIGFDMAVLYPRWRDHTRLVAERPAVAKAFAAEDLKLFPDPDPALARSKIMTPQRLAEFDAAWGAGDIDKLLSFMAEDAVYSASVGPEPGETFRGCEDLRRGFEQMLEHDSKRKRTGGETWALGNFGFARWEFEERDPDGRTHTIEGIDHFEFTGDLIRRKDAFRKTVNG